eukprot:3566655-Rhodomonas_salina.3
MARRTRKRGGGGRGIREGGKEGEYPWRRAGYPGCSCGSQCRCFAGSALHHVRTEHRIHGRADSHAQMQKWGCSPGCISAHPPQCMLRPSPPPAPESHVSTQNRTENALFRMRFRRSTQPVAGKGVIQRMRVMQRVSPGAAPLLRSSSARDPSSC